MADKYPWFPFYAADFLTDEKAMAMGYREVGIYLTLLCHQWIGGSISADASLAQATLKLGSSQTGEDADYAAFERVVQTCFAPHPTLAGRLVNLRLYEIQAAQVAHRERLKESGRKGGNAKSQATARLQPGYSEAVAYKRKRKNIETPTPLTNGKHVTASWVAQFGDRWKAVRGKPSYPRIGKALSDLIAAHGVRQVGAAWDGYLSDREGKAFAGPEDFAGNYEVYRAKHALESSPAGDGWVPMPDEPEVPA